MIPRRFTSPFSVFANAVVESRSLITCLSETFAAAARPSSIVVSLETSVARAKSSGATA